MKLYSCEYGPGPRRVGLYIAMKGIDDIEVISMPSYAKRDDAFLKKSPGGKIPLLETDDGQYIYESQAIVQFLEAIYPDPPMRGMHESEIQRVDIQSCLINDFFIIPLYRQCTLRLTCRRSLHRHMMRTWCRVRCGALGSIRWPTLWAAIHFLPAFDQPSPILCYFRSSNIHGSGLASLSLHI